MSSKLPGDCLVLIIEDEYLIALGLKCVLEDEGFGIAGPVGSVGDALLLAERGGIDAAVLDARLDGEPVTAVADALEALDIPFVFHSGYGPEHLPQRHRHRPLLRKPSNPSAVVTALRNEIGRRGHR